MSLIGGKSRAKGAEERGFKNLQNSGTQELPKPELQTPNLKLPSRTSAYLCATKSGANTGHRPPTTTDFKTFAFFCAPIGHPTRPVRLSRRTLRHGSIGDTFQALRARLRSFSPYGSLRSPRKCLITREKDVPERTGSKVFVLSDVM